MIVKKIFTSIFVVILIFLCFSTKCVQASIFDFDEEESEIEKTIDADDGGLFEKIIAKMIRRSSRGCI